MQWKGCAESNGWELLFWLVMLKAKVNKLTVLFLVRKLGLGRGVVGLSLVITEVSRGGGMRW